MATKTRESGLWRRLQLSWRAISGLHAQRIESSAGLGVPDVEGCYRGASFWVELKTAARPARASTRVHLPHFTTDQRDWLLRRHEVGGCAWLLVQVGTGAQLSLYLLRGAFLAQVGQVPEEELMRQSCIPTKCTPSELLQYLVHPPE